MIGGKRTIIKVTPGLPSSLENPIVVTGTRYDKLPSALQASLGVSLGVNELRQQLPDINLSWAKINNHKLTLSFKGATQADQDVLNALVPAGITDISQLPSQISAYLVMVVPELKLNGQVVGSGQPMQLGYEAKIRFTTRSPTIAAESFYSPIVAGSYLALASGGGSVSPNTLSALQSQITATKVILESGDATQISTLTRESILGDMFYAGVLGYYAQFTALNYIAGLQQKGHLSLLTSIGTYGYVPKVNYSFGFPTSITPGGIEMDLDAVTIATADTNGSLQGRKQIVQQAGVISSALEHAIPEQMFVSPTNPGEAISAVKAISKAMQAGQRIYTINSSNMATVLPNINHSPFVMGEITNAVNAGFEVITHTDAVTVPGWSGAGYIILDKATGDGVYKIESGGNGSFFWIGVVYGIIIASLIIVVDSLPLSGIAKNPLFIALLLAVTSAFAIYGLYVLLYGPKEADCFRLGIINGMGGVAILKGFRTKKIIGSIIGVLLLGIADAKANINKCIN